jgi:hypothetical protein
MAINIKPEVVQLIGAILAFGPQALVVQDLLKDIIPKEVIPLGYLLLLIGFGWEILLMVRR